MSVLPVISVIMAAYNAERDIGGAIESILNQSFRDFEFIIINDGSSDNTAAIISDYAARDKRIKVVMQDNAGLTVSLNRGLAKAVGQYIARQDADDISYPERFEKQLALFANPDIVLVGGNSVDAYEDGSTSRWGSYNEAELQKVVFLKTPFPHSTAMFRAATVKQLGFYDESFRTSQDMELWMRFAKEGRLAMIADPVLKRRIASSSISIKRRWRQFYDAFRARWKHNSGNRIAAVYHSLRSMIIALLPRSIIRALKS